MVKQSEWPIYEGDADSKFCGWSQLEDLWAVGRFSVNSLNKYQSGKDLPHSKFPAGFRLRRTRNLANSEIAVRPPDTTSRLA
jgi:hypothetical protein